MSDSKVESGAQLFARLNQRPNLINLYPVLIPIHGPKPSEVIQISGETSTGKTLLISEFLSNCLLPVEVDNIHIGGKNAGAVIINTDYHFHIFKLVLIMESMLKKCLLPSNRINGVINESLKNLYVINCFDSEQLHVTIYNLDSVIVNKKISLLVLDSISAYYWGDKFKSSIIGMDSYEKKILRALQNVSKDYNLIIAFTTSNTFLSKYNETDKCSKETGLEKINYKIHLEKVSNKSNSFIANVMLPNCSFINRKYKICNLIKWDNE